MKIALQKSLSPLEHAVMQVIWSEGNSTADQVRLALADERPLKDSTIRTVLRRLEEKGFVTHHVQGRTYVYSHRLPPQNVAVRAVRQIIDRFCEGSVEQLLIGMVDGQMLTREQLQALAQKIDANQTTNQENHHE